MKKLSFILLLQLLFLNLFSQKLSQEIYWLPLSDKEGNGYTLTDPGEFLSQRSLNRRIRQNINLTEEDLPVNPAYIDSLQKMGLKVLGVSKWFNAAIIKSTDTLLLDTLDHYSFISDFSFGVPGKKRFPDFSEINKSEIITPFQSPLTYPFGPSYSQISIINGAALHSLGYRGNNMQIAVIDGGFYHADIYTAFDSLRNENRLLGFRDFSHSEIDFFSTASHGMSVLSTMAANVPGEIIGTAPKASYWLLKSEIVESETPLEEAYWVLAAEFADSVGADIITSSLGYSKFDDASLDHNYSEMDGKTTLVSLAAEKAFSKGMVVISSAGNEGNKPWRHIMAPSDGPNVLAVGAIDTFGNVAAFSSRGPSSDQRIKPDVLAVGYKSIVINSTGVISEGYGTSYAGPQIAGMVACLWEAAPGKTNLEIIQSVRRSSSHFLSPDDSSGYGIPDFLNALFILKSSVPIVPANQISILPNPNQGVFEIRSDIFSREEFKVSIYDLRGKKIYSGLKSFSAGFSRITELENHNSGLYFIVAESGGEKYFGKVIIMNQ